jgi:hypothetical protein
MMGSHTDISVVIIRRFGADVSPSGTRYYSSKRQNPTVLCAPEP